MKLEVVLSTQTTDEVKKPKVKRGQPDDGKAERRDVIRPKVAELIDRVVKENAPTWQELSKR